MVDFLGYFIKKKKRKQNSRKRFTTAETKILYYQTIRAQSCEKSITLFLENFIIKRNKKKQLEKDNQRKNN